MNRDGLFYRSQVIKKRDGFPAIPFLPLRRHCRGWLMPSKAWDDPMIMYRYGTKGRQKHRQR